MGCISSKPEVKTENPNVFRVININDEGIDLWSGQMEITSTDLILYRKGKEPTNWPLKCVRRYGYDSDLFSFESGRRCQTGAGIYAFRCNRAGSLFRNLQERLQRRAFLTEDGSVSSTNTVSRISREQPINSVGVVSVNSMTPRNITIAFPHQDEGTTDSSYLEPNRQRFNLDTRLGSIGSGPVSPGLTSPGSPNSFNTILEVTALPAYGNSHQISNVYQEFPVNPTGKKLSLDIPPQELAPTTPATATHANDEELRMYENTSPSSSNAVRHSETRQYMNLVIGETSSHEKLETPTTAGSFRLLRLDSGSGGDPNRCYENMEPLRQMRHSKPEIFSKIELPLKSGERGSEPTTPTSPGSPNSKGVTYVLLDLNNPSADAEEVTADVAANNNNTATTNNNNVSSSESSRKIGNMTFSNSFDSSYMISNQNMTTSKSLGGLLVESPTNKRQAGYALIDFHKTIALSNTMNTNTFGSPESVRRTRHS